MALYKVHHKLMMENLQNLHHRYLLTMIYAVTYQLILKLWIFFQKRDDLREKIEKNYHLFFDS